MDARDQTSDIFVRDDEEDAGLPARIFEVTLALIRVFEAAHVVDVRAKFVIVLAEGLLQRDERERLEIDLTFVRRDDGRQSAGLAQ